MRVSVLCPDVSANAAGRADLLAKLLEPLGSVEVIGPRSLSGVWEPVAAGPVRYTSVSTRRMPGFIATMTDLARRADGDLIYASKTRLGSAGVGYLKRVAGRRPLLLDIDDWELGFYIRSGFWGTVGRALNLGNPDGLPWTWLCERLTALADGVTVASRFLQKRFIPGHVLGGRTSPGAQKVPNPVVFLIPSFGFRVQGSGAATQELAASRAESLNFAMEATGVPGVATAASMPNQPMTEHGPLFPRD